MQHHRSLQYVHIQVDGSVGNLGPICAASPLRTVLQTAENGSTHRQEEYFDFSTSNFLSEKQSKDFPF